MNKDELQKTTSSKDLIHKMIHDESCRGLNVAQRLKELLRKENDGELPENKVHTDPF
ncbi:MAG: hypothetical protein RSF90_04720 [Pygmaiobacter sp.]